MLKVALIQSTLHWENVPANRAHFYQLLQRVATGTDLVILPEMFSTGFSMQPEKWAEYGDGPTIKWMQEMAATFNFTLTGSVIIKENNTYYNQLQWVSPSGEINTYNKRHLFSLAGEDKHYASGTSPLIVSLKGYRIMPLICYDLRFPVWSRNKHAYDVAIYVANWPERRAFHWKHLLIARAIENQAYVIGVNRVGPDGNGVSHSGDSVAVNALGSEIAAATPFKEEIVYVDINASHIQEVRAKYNFLNDQDGFTLD